MSDPVATRPTYRHHHALRTDFATLFQLDASAGLQLFDIVATHKTKTSLLDDVAYYDEKESRSRLLPKPIKGQRLGQRHKRQQQQQQQQQGMQQRAGQRASSPPPAQVHDYAPANIQSPEVSTLVQSVLNGVLTPM